MHKKRECDRFGAGCHSYAKSHAHVRGELPFKGFYLVAEDEYAAF